MENYENDQLQPGQEMNPQPESEAAPQQPYTPPQSQPYSGMGVGRKESPFADSPYEMHHQPQRDAYRQPDPNAYRAGSTYVPPVPPQMPGKPKKAKSGKGWKTVLCAVLALAVVAGSCGITATLVNNRWEKRTDEIISRVEMQTVQMDELRQQIAANAAGGNSISGTVTVGEGLTPGQVYAQNVKSVVLISCEITSSTFGQTVKGTSFGSGFILTKDGYVVTNAHVVNGASAIYVSTHDGEKLKAELVGSDTTNDVALLKVEADNLSPVTIGSSDNLIVGDQVVAIGNPLGDLTSTMTVGYVSAKDRDVTTDNTIINMIQTDAAINSGNSGGPLFNMRGEVVGITTAKYSGSSSSGASIESIGFAIPIDDVIGMLNDLKDYGYVTGAYLGVSVTDVDPVAQNYGVPAGAHVREVVPGYCAEEAGLQVDDIIIGVGGHEVESITDLTRALRKFKAGDTTEILVYRSGTQVTLSITLDERPADPNSVGPVNPDAAQMPEDGNYEEWYEFFFGDKG